MISTPHGEYENDGRAVVKERLTSEPVSEAYTLPRPTATAATVGRTPSSAAYMDMQPLRMAFAEWGEKPPAPAATHPPQSGTMTKGG